MNRTGHVWFQSSMVLCALSIIPAVARAQVGSETILYFGSIGQGAATVTNTNAAYMGVYLPNSVPVGPNACVPTSVIGGLTYLEHYQNVTNDTDPFTVSPNSAAQLNNLATSMSTWNTTNTTGPNQWTNVGGTSVPSAFNGLQSYLSATGNNPAPQVQISGQVSPANPAGFVAISPVNQTAGTYNAGMNIANVTPTATFMANALNANDGVEFGLQWGTYSGTTFTPSGGGHFLTLQAINIVSGTGTISFFDPWGVNANPPSTTNGFVSATVTTVSGFLYVTYPITWTGGDLDTSNNASPSEMMGANGQTGRILSVMVESTPEPASGMISLAAFALLGLRRIKKA